MGNAQKIVVAILLLSLLIGAIDTFDFSGSYDEDSLKGHVSYLNDIGESEFEQDIYSGVGNDNLIQDISVSNPLAVGALIWDLAMNTFNPLSVAPWEQETPLENALAWILAIIRGLMYVIVIIELYNLFINKGAGQ